ncbi:hypothetical protein LSTR_LSTR009686 [Laodelphax striatellus]|uniref:NADH dehydrogenase [ubiquinone] 1 alpha subcomplex subunit 11 n=1 Tax=Laodelphax striatellus TaxID=195883 RepID=A0A482WNI9_LAOST|nr:hypothetical protein LSTR_LSTR009686 [Laodelphax striatellus]
MPYSYFEHPDGEDTIRKIAFTSRYALIAGLFKSTCDVILFPAPTGYLSTAGKVFYVTAPLVGATAIGTGVISLSTNLRKKDDAVNYFIGGVVGGLSYGMFKGRLGTACYAAGLFGMLCLTFKYNNQRGVIFDQSERNRPCDVDVWRKYEDYTLTRSPPKGWVAGSN